MCPPPLPSERERERESALAVSAVPRWKAGRCGAFLENHNALAVTCLLCPSVFPVFSFSCSIAAVSAFLFLSLFLSIYFCCSIYLKSVHRLCLHAPHTLGILSQVACAPAALIWCVTDERSCAGRRVWNPEHTDLRRCRIKTLDLIASLLDYFIWPIIALHRNPKSED